MELHYGDMVDFEPVLTLWMLAVLASAPGSRGALLLTDAVADLMKQVDADGVFGDTQDGVPLAYHVRNGHPADWYIVPPPMTWTRFWRSSRTA